jgi:hypothetical protein
MLRGNPVSHRCCCLLEVAIVIKKKSRIRFVASRKTRIGPRFSPSIAKTMSLIRDAFDEPKSPDKISIDVNTSVAYGKPGYDCMGHLERDLKPYVYWDQRSISASYPFSTYQVPLRSNDHHDVVHGILSRYKKCIGTIPSSPSLPSRTCPHTKASLPVIHRRLLVGAPEGGAVFTKERVLPSCTPNTHAQAPMCTR